jgi:hypothetical protein
VSFSSRLALAAATVTAAAGAIAAGPPETGFDRPGGVYSNVPAKDPAACAIACAQDRICMSWTFRATEFVGCSLKAVVPGAVPDHQAVSGIADRAAEFLPLVSIAPPAPASVEAAPPAPAANLAAAKPQSSPPAASKDEASELLGAPASLPDAIGDIAPASFHPAAFIRGPLPSPRPILEIAAPQPFRTTAPLAAPVLRATIRQQTPVFQTAALVLPPEPDPLAAPAPLTAKLASVSRLVYRAPPVLISIAQEFTPIVAIQTPVAPWIVRLTSATRIAYREPPVLALPAPAYKYTPIVSIEAPAPLRTITSVTAAAAPLPLQTPRPALNDRIVLALPQPAEQPSPMVLPAAYASLDQSMLSQASAPAPQDEEELLGAP